MTSSTLIDAMRAAGLAPDGEVLELDGRLHRFDVPGDRHRRRNGWYVGHQAPIAAGAFGSWRTGESHTWRAETDRAQTPAEQAEMRRQIDAMRRQHAEEDAKIKAAARIKAERLWRTARQEVDAGHRYLVAKRVKPWGIRQLRGMLVIPARDADGVLHTLQFISPDGTKRLLSGGRIRGCYHAIGRYVDTLLVAEGFATAATLYEATGHATACAFFAGNLESVARALRGKFPTARIVVCADDDRETPGNPGLTAGRRAASAVGGLLAVPQFHGVAQ